MGGAPAEASLAALEDGSSARACIRPGVADSAQHALVAGRKAAWREGIRNQLLHACMCAHTQYTHVCTHIIHTHTHTHTGPSPRFKGLIVLCQGHPQQPVLLSLGHSPTEKEDKGKIPAPRPLSQGRPGPGSRTGWKPSILPLYCETPALPSLSFCALSLLNPYPGTF